MAANAMTGVRPGALPMIAAGADVVAAELGGDVNAQVAAMMLMSARDKRQQVQQARRSEERLVEAMENRQVDAMRKQADRIRAAGICEGVGKIVSGSLSIAGGVSQIAGASEADNITNFKSLKKGDDDASAAWAAVGQVAPAVGQVAAGVGEVAAAGHRAAATQREADAAEADNRASAARRRLDDLRDEQKDAQEMSRTAIDFLRGINETAASADRAAIFQRA